MHLFHDALVSFAERRAIFMNNDYAKYDTNGYHDSHCEGPNCNCDSRRYGYGTEFNGSAVLGVDGFLHRG